MLRGRAAADSAGLGRGAQLVKVVKVKVEGGAKAARRLRKSADRVLPRTLNRALNAQYYNARRAILRAVDVPRQARVN